MYLDRIKKGEKKMHMSKWKLKLAVAGALALVIGLAVPAGALFDNKFEKEVANEAAAVKLVREVQRGGYNVVTTEELKKLFDGKKEMIVVDTMPFEESYKKMHIPGAVQFLFPIPEMMQWDIKETGGKSEEDFARLLGSDKNKVIVFYCGFVKCTRSHNGAAWAVKMGYQNVYRYPGGIFAWKGAGYPAESAE